MAAIVDVRTTHPVRYVQSLRRLGQLELITTTEIVLSIFMIKNYPWSHLAALHRTFSATIAATTRLALRRRETLKTCEKKVYANSWLFSQCGFCSYWLMKTRMMLITKIQQMVEGDADRRIISSSVVSRHVPVTRPRATPHADTTSIPAVQARHIKDVRL